MTCGQVNNHHPYPFTFPNSCQTILESEYLYTFVSNKSLWTVSRRLSVSTSCATVLLKQDILVWGVLWQFPLKTFILFITVVEYNKINHLNYVLSVEFSSVNSPCCETNHNNSFIFKNNILFPLNYKCPFSTLPSSPWALPFYFLTLWISLL